MKGAPQRRSPIIRDGRTKSRPQERRIEGWRRGKRRCWTSFPNCRTTRLVSQMAAKVTPTLRTVSLSSNQKHFISGRKTKPFLTQTLFLLLFSIIYLCLKYYQLPHCTVYQQLDFFSQLFTEELRGLTLNSHSDFTGETRLTRCSVVKPLRRVWSELIVRSVILNHFTSRVFQLSNVWRLNLSLPASTFLCLLFT